jgi:hypothetical protein
MKVIAEPDLTREPGAFIEVRFGRQDRRLVLAYRARVAGKNLDPAGRAAGIAAAAMKYVDAMILDRENQSLAFFRFKGNGAPGSICLDIYHQLTPLSFL